LRGHYNQKLLCGKKKKVEHASRARFDRLGGVTGSGVKHVSYCGAACLVSEQKRNPKPLLLSSLVVS
jgi:hypothetical protein